MDTVKQYAQQRTGEDRRSWLSQLDFPYLDSHGTLVLEDRRNNVERRIPYPEQCPADQYPRAIRNTAN